MTLVSNNSLYQKLIFLFSLLGMLTTVHLHIMNEMGFEQGCFGFETNEQVENTFDCGSVVNKGPTFLGLSNIIIGFLFYLSITILTFMSSFVSKNKILKYYKLRDIIIAVGFLYSIFLAYQQHFIMQEYCALCLISGFISTVLFILIILHNLSSKTNYTEFKKFKYISLLIFITFVFFDFYYFNEKFSFNITKSECSFDDSKPKIKNYQSLISEYDIKFGNPKSKNIIIEIFDPNCKHCKTLHEEMIKIISEYKDEIYIIIKPSPLWSKSIQQIQALLIANEYGKFKEMLKEQFEKQNPGKGLNLVEIGEIAKRINLEPEDLIKRIKNADYLNYIIQENKKVKKQGINSAPTLLLNGRVLPNNSRNADCIGELINH